MKLRHTLVLLLCAAVLPGCASIIVGSTQPVTFKSSPEGAQVVISNRAGQNVRTGVTPLSISLNRGAGYFRSEKYVVTVTKPGYETRVYDLIGSVNGWYFLNIFFGGLIGWFIVDPITGAMYTITPPVVDTTLYAD